MATPLPTPKPVENEDDDMFNNLFEIIKNGVVMLSWGEPDSNDEEEEYDDDDDDEEDEITTTTQDEPPATKRFKISEDEKKVTPRFQLFSALIQLDKYPTRKPFYLYGDIKLYSPPYGQASCVSSSDIFTLLGCDSDRPVPMLNNYTIRSIHHPSIPVYDTFLPINLNLYAKNRDQYDDDDDKQFFQLSNGSSQDHKLRVQKYDTFCMENIKVRDGSFKMIYIVLTNPVDAALDDITFKTHPDYDVSGIQFSLSFYAYYGGDHADTSCNLPLLVADLVTLSDNSKISLDTSSLAVPADGKLVIWASICDMFKGDMYVEKHFPFTPKHKGSTNVCIQGPRCSLEVNVNWKFHASTEENDDLAAEDLPKITHAAHGQSHQQVSGEGGDEPQVEGMVLDVVKETGETPIC